MATVKFNGKELPSFVRLVGREIAALPDIEVKSMELPRQLGSSFLYTKLGSKKESLEFLLLPDKLQTVDSASKEFAAWLRGDNFSPSKIEFTDRPNEYGMAQVTGSVSVSDLFLYGTLSVEFLYSDPLMYSNSPVSVTLNAPATVNYTGEVQQPPVIKFTLKKAASKIEVANSKAGKSVVLNGTFTVGTVITVDNQRKRIVVNDTVNMKVLALSSEWFNLGTGSNVISVKLDNTAVTDAPLTITSSIANY